MKIKSKTWQSLYDRPFLLVVFCVPWQDEQMCLYAAIKNYLKLTISYSFFFFLKT